MNIQTLSDDELNLLKAEVPKQLRDALEREKLTPAWAARSLGYSRNHFYTVLNGKNEPSIHLVLLMKSLKERLDKFHQAA